MADGIKSMQLYPRAERIYNELKALGYGDDDPVDVDVLNRFDQLHYHGTDAIDVAIDACGVAEGHKVLEVGSGWGGCSRYLAKAGGADMTAVELQTDYHAVAMDLTRRADLAEKVEHVNADFLEVPLADESFDHAVSWLALFHIPDRHRYQSKIAAKLKPGGGFFAEDLYLARPLTDTETQDCAVHLFPNSLVSIDEYRTSLQETGFDAVQMDDMTQDWSEFTATRLDAFRENKANYEAMHGADGFAAIHVFYEKMAGYFADGLVGGVRVSARKPD
jgi:cyclopropane fatty-acyl-phospholipid synthase-like methyltransferase